MAAFNQQFPLAKFLAKAPCGTDIFPDLNVDYFDRFCRVDEYLNAEVHPKVNQGATAHDRLWLTDHGPAHISTVISRASRLIFAPKCILTPYEAYLLLLAIHFHDVGNVFGRQEHEKRVDTIMWQLDDSLIGSDSFEKRLITDIAMSHGGKTPEGDFDTIGSLPYKRNPPNNEPRAHLLAAILRFADELADDFTRTSRFEKQNELFVPAGTEIFHDYADRLRRVDIDLQNRLVTLSFELNPTAAHKQYNTPAGPVYLFDEILNRILKMAKEHAYCSRFMHPHVHIDSLNIDVVICNDNYSKVLKTVTYVIREHGYPVYPSHLNELCPELYGLNGEVMSNMVRQLIGENDAP